MVVAPLSIATAVIFLRNSMSLLVASSAENSMFGQNFLAYATICFACSSTSSGVILSLYSMCIGEVAMKTWILGSAAPLTASHAASMSLTLQRARLATVQSLTFSAMVFTDSKSPGDTMANPASIMSTLSFSRQCATSIFSWRFMLQPGDCSPSLSVVSKIFTWSIIIL